MPSVCQVRYLGRRCMSRNKPDSVFSIKANSCSWTLSCVRIRLLLVSDDYTPLGCHPDTRMEIHMLLLAISLGSTITMARDVSVLDTGHGGEVADDADELGQLDRDKEALAHAVPIGALDLLTTADVLASFPGVGQEQAAEIAASAHRLVLGEGPARRVGIRGDVPPLVGFWSEPGSRAPASVWATAAECRDHVRIRACAGGRRRHHRHRPSSFRLP